MDPWEDRKRVYAELGKERNQNAEDMIARHIVKGLGCPNSKPETIYKLEQQVLGHVTAERPLIERVLQILRVVMRGRGHQGGLAWEFELMPNKHAQPVVNAFENADLLHSRLVVFSWHEQMSAPEAYSIWHEDELGGLTPPLVVLACPNQLHMRVVRQQVTPFVKQFGPFAV